MKVQFTYTKTVQFETEMDQEEVDKIPLHGTPDWVDEMADDIDNEQPICFERFKVLKEK